ncbi:MAG: hypothetical protein RLZZ08_540 [Pseudomonadota bacterium]|jgi:aspartyl protease family protein
MVAGVKASHLLLLIVVAGGLTGWLAPGLPASGTASTPAGANQGANFGGATEAPVADQRDQWLAGEMTLLRQPDGHFYADAAIEAQPVHMLVDTGASVVALTGEDAQAIGLNWDARDVRPVARGASGEVRGVPVTLDRVALGEIEVRNVPAIIIPQGLGISLLGQSFLSAIRRVEIRDGAMVLGG